MYHDFFITRAVKYFLIILLFLSIATASTKLSAIAITQKINITLEALVDGEWEHHTTDEIRMLD